MERKEDFMEVKINKEIRDYTENIYFGLTLRQFIFSVCAIITAIVLYFIFNKILNKELVSWVCILGASPFAILGFFKYNGLPAEKIIWCYIKTEFLIPKKMGFKSVNYYYELTKEYIEKESEEVKDEVVKDNV